MKLLLLLSALVALAAAAPGGYYYQESSSRSSSSSYKNNELQHHSEDESHYSRQGDSEGRTQPKVNTYSQHLQYENPHNQNNAHSTSFGSQSQNTLRHGEEDAYAARQAVGSDGIVRSVSGNRDHYSYTATYGVSAGEAAPLRGGQYDTQSNLLSVTQTLQNDLSRKLNTAITQQRRFDSTGGNTYVEANLRNLERELKANLSRQLQEELQRHYGTQMNKGSYSYTVQNGHYSPTANYNTQELQDLTSQLETNLIQQLRNQYQNTQSSSSSSSSSSSYSSSSSQQTGQGSRAHTTMYRPTYDAFPLHPEVRPTIPLTDVLSQVQNIVDARLNDALSGIERQYVTHNTYNDVPNYDVILENMKRDLKQNISSILQITLVEHYGTQEEHHNYFYSSRNVGSGSKVANYNRDDLNSLKQQIENNLTQKLKNSIHQQRQNYQTRQSYSHSQTYSSNYNSGHSTSINGKSNTPEVYTSYLVFTPSRRPDSTYSQSSTHNSQNTYGSYNEQTNTRPSYTSTDTQRLSSSPTDTQRPSYTPTDTYRPVYTPTDTQRPIYTQTDNQRPVYTPTDTQRPIYIQTDSRRPDYTPVDNRRPIPTDNQRFTNTQTDTQGTIRYYQPSSSQSTNYGTNNYQTNSQTQENQRVEQLEYDYSPTGGNSPTGTGPTQVSQAPVRGTYYPSNSGASVSTGGVYYPTSNTRYPSGSGATHSSGGSGSNYQTNYQTSQQSSESSHKIVTGQREGGIEYTSGVSRPQQSEYQAELINIRDQVQSDLSRQLNTAIEKQRQHSSSYSSSSVASSQVLNDLSEELKRNLTKNVEKALNDHYGRTGVRGGYSFTVSTGGRINPGNYNREQLTALTNQLQEDLLRQLREGLAQQSYSRSSSHSSSNYEPVMSQGTYGHGGTNSYRTYSSGSSYSSYGSSGGQGECCMQADDSTTIAEDGLSQHHERGDINIEANNKRKIEDSNSENDRKQQKTDDIITKDHDVDIEVVPPADTEVTTPKLARDKPSTKKPITVEPDRQTAKPQQSVPTAPLSEYDYYDATQNTDCYDQQVVGQSHFDQATIDDYDQFTQQHAADNTQQTGRILQSTVIDLSGHNNQHAEQQFSQQSQDLHQQTEDLNQQTQHLHQQTDDLNLQQTEDLSQQTTHLNQKAEDVNQQTQDFNQQTEDLNQQNEDLHQQSEDLSQQTQNLNQQTEDLSQQSENFNQHTQNLNEQSENLNQHVVNLNQQTQSVNGQRSNAAHVYHQTNTDAQNSASENSQHSSQEVLSENPEISHHQNGGSYRTRHSQSTFQSYSAQSSSSHSSSSSSESRQIHYGTVNLVPLHTTGNLEQQHLDLQNANVVQDVSHQVVVPSSDESTSNANDQKLEKTVEIVTTEAPGFWKRLGSKISKTYHKAKDSITSIG